METKIETGNRAVTLTDIFRKIIPFLGLAIMIAVFQIFGDGRLLTPGNIKSILNQSVYVAIMAFGDCFCIFPWWNGFVLWRSYWFQCACSHSCGESGCAVSGDCTYKYSSGCSVVCIKWICICIFESVPIYYILMYYVYVSRILNTVCAKEKYSVPVYIYNYDNWTIKITLLVVSFIICWLLFEKS